MKKVIDNYLGTDHLFFYVNNLLLFCFSLALLTELIRAQITGLQILMCPIISAETVDCQAPLQRF